jgi:hypothetical protein
MKILSLDVGIKNLAFCLFEKPVESDHFMITKWDVVNISEKESFKCVFMEKNCMCNKPAKYEKDTTFYCLKHAKKQTHILQTKEMKTEFINKQKIQKLTEIADHLNLHYEKPIKKAELAFLINEHYTTICLQEICSKNASKVDLINIGKNIKTHFEKIFDEEGCIDYVIIENQISPIANRMKTIQGMIAQYFIMKNSANNIEFISATNKLKDYDTKNECEKMKYGDRKKFSILKCSEIINSDFKFSDKYDYFNSHKKKDDLADSFLQGLWFIKNKL